MSRAREAVFAHCLAAPPTLGRSRLICIDGPAGSGKTTLSDALAATGAPVVHMDDLYEGWHGLLRVTTQLERITRPLAEGRPGWYRRWDWLADAWAETVTVPPAELLVIEGVGAGSLVIADLITTLVWVEAPPALRLERGLARDGADLADQWQQWSVDEAAFFATQRTRERADLRFNGFGWPLAP